MKLLESLIHFLLMDVKNEKETKDMAVLIRIECCLLALYYIIVGILSAYIQHYILGILLIGIVGLLVGSFICTYEDHTVAGLVLLLVAIDLASTLLTFSMGFALDFHVMIYATILLVYFNKTKRMRWKRLYTAGVMTYVCLLSQLYKSISFLMIPSESWTLTFRIINILTFSCMMLFIAYSFCTKFNQAEEKLRRINDNLERMANYDALTGLANRRHMNDQLSQLVFEFNRSNKIFSIAIGDIDHFKHVNDTYGHDTGDYVLTTAAGIFQSQMKGKGYVARWGGEEFLFVFVGMDLNQSYNALETLRQTIEQTPMDFKSYHFRITMSYGVEEYASRRGLESTIKRADDKLYRAKTTGRNQVVK